MIGDIDKQNPSLSHGLLNNIKRDYFGSFAKSFISLSFILMVIWVAPEALNWFIFNATYKGDAILCLKNGGACWAFIGTKLNLILFGAFPPDLLWRPKLFLVMIFLISVYGFFNIRKYALVLTMWLVATIVGFMLLKGGIFGMEPVDRARWGGLPITILITVFGLFSAFPIGIMLTLGRRSKKTIISIPCRLYVDIVRSIPAITVVFMTFAIIPLLLPEGISFDKLLRAGLGLSLFTAAYFAEAIRGAFQALPHGQSEAAQSLGLSYWQYNRLVVLPQVIAESLQPIANISIAFVKNSSLLIIIGLFDLLGSARASLYDGNWQGFYKELYLFVGIIYLIICLFIQYYIGSIENERKTRLSR